MVCRLCLLDEILHELPASRASFPVKYLGLPLSVWQLKRVDCQYLEDKVAGNLVSWEGGNITTKGRCVLVKSVLTSQVIFHATSLTIPPGTLASINKIERAFLWSGTDKTTGAKCKVNWAMVCRPNDLGGLGVLHLGKFFPCTKIKMALVRVERLPSDVGGNGQSL